MNSKRKSIFKGEGFVNFSSSILAIIVVCCLDSSSFLQVIPARL